MKFYFIHFTSYVKDIFQRKGKERITDDFQKPFMIIGWIIIIIVIFLLQDILGVLRKTDEGKREKTAEKIIKSCANEHALSKDERFLVVRECTNALIHGYGYK